VCVLIKNLMKSVLNNSEANNFYQNNSFDDGYLSMRTAILSEPQ
jgi:hypothetical protein